MQIPAGDDQGPEMWNGPLYALCNRTCSLQLSAIIRIIVGLPPSLPRAPTAMLGQEDEIAHFTPRRPQCSHAAGTIARKFGITYERTNDLEFGEEDQMKTILVSCNTNASQCPSRVGFQSGFGRASRE